MRLNSIKRKEILRFLVGGGSAVVTDYIVYRLLIWLSFGVTMSKGISFVTGSIVGFVINKLWTFESKKFIKAEVVKYIILYTITATINAWVNDIVLLLFNIQLFAFLCATGVSTVLNFIGQKFFVFYKKEN